MKKRGVIVAEQQGSGGFLVRHEGVYLLSSVGAIYQNRRPLRVNEKQIPPITPLF